MFHDMSGFARNGDGKAESPPDLRFPIWSGETIHIWWTDRDVQAELVDALNSIDHSYLFAGMARLPFPGTLRPSIRPHCGFFDLPQDVLRSLRDREMARIAWTAGWRRLEFGEEGPPRIGMGRDGRIYRFDGRGFLIEIAHPEGSTTRVDEPLRRALYEPQCIFYADVRAGLRAPGTW